MLASHTGRTQREGHFWAFLGPIEAVDDVRHVCQSGSLIGPLGKYL